MEHSELMDGTTPALRLLPCLSLALLLLLMSGTAVAQPETYFSLNSDATTASGDVASVNLYVAGQVPSLEFRLYKINDAVQFFTRLEDLHRFGGQAPPLPTEPTPIERFHQFKRRWVRYIEDTFRHQFTQESRYAIRQWIDSRDQPQVASTSRSPNATTYATVPVLNPQQVVAIWKWNTSGSDRFRSERIKLPKLDRGTYVVEATNGELRAFTITLVTDIALITKASAGKLLVWAVDRKTGESKPSAELFVISKRKELAKLRTNDSGIAEVTLTDAKPESLAVMARTSDDFAISTPSDYAVQLREEGSVTGYVYTDRPVYRPGHTVHFKSIIRTHDGKTYHLPARQSLDVEIHDPEDKTLYRKTLEISSSGSLSGDFEIPRNGALGYYNIQARYGETWIYGNFHVEEYRKPEYHVTVTAPAWHQLQGTEIQATIDSRYFFGEPVAGARVQYVVHRSAYFFYPADEDDEYGISVGDDYEDYGGDQILEASGVLDADGKLTVSVPTALANTDQRYRIEARVTDEGNREISGAVSVVATIGNFVVNVTPEQYVYNERASGVFRIKTQDYDGNPVSTPVELELRPWSSGRAAGSPVFSTTVLTDANGDASANVPLNRAGSHQVEAFARTPENRVVRDRSFVWVTGGTARFEPAQRERIQIIPDKALYKAGDVARVMLVSSVPEANLLFTVEGHRLNEYRVLQTTSTATVVEVPVREEHIPNFFVSALFVRDNQLYNGQKSIKVSNEARSLTVDIQPSSPSFKPGEPAIYTVTTKDHLGSPVSAEVSLGIVDEAIYSVRQESAEDITQFFYGRVYNRVALSTSLTFYFSGAAGKRPLQLTDLRTSTALAQIKQNPFVQPRVRKAFPDTAFWAASLTTDSNGRAEARLEFPDSLTTWRATARSVSRDTRVGSATRKTIVRKDLILRLTTPRFFTEGDEVTVSAIVHNYLDSTKRARISLDVEGLELISGTTQDIEIPSRTDGRADWRVRATKTRDVRLLGKALTDEDSDALELIVPVLPYGVKLTSANNGIISGDSTLAEFEVAFPDNISPDSRRIELQVTPSVAGAVFGALDYLTSFPYGCTEQTMSSFLPNVIVSRALEDLKVDSRVDPTVLRRKVSEGLQRLYDSQHPDGGWGWWPTDDSHAFMTAYVVSGLVQARQAGVEVRQDIIENGAQWLAAEFGKTEAVVADLRAYLFYALALAGSATPEQAATIWEARTRMTAHGKAILGIALEGSDRAKAMELAEELERIATSEGPEAFWRVDQDSLLDFSGDSSPEATAYAVKLLSRLRPASPLLPKAIFWLINHRNEGFYWYSTKQTAMVVYGITDYLKISGELKPDHTVRIFANDKLVLTRAFDEKDALSPTPASLTITSSQLAGSNRIRIQKTGTGPLYWSARSEYFSRDEGLVRAGTVQLNVLREYFRLVPSNDGQRIVHKLEAFQGEAQAGDVLAVRLTVSGGPWRYLMAEDPIPSGTEFLKRIDLYEIDNRPPWWAELYTRRELRDDRAVFFQTRFEGQSQFLYLLKIVNPGAFRVSPARVSPMYQPQFLATSTARQVNAK